jgi:hypothetical protein
MMRATMLWLALFYVLKFETFDKKTSYLNIKNYIK